MPNIIHRLLLITCGNAVHAGRTKLTKMLNMSPRLPRALAGRWLSGGQSARFVLSLTQAYTQPLFSILQMGFRLIRRFHSTYNKQQLAIVIK